MKLVYRDDDVGKLTDVEVIKHIHNQLLENHKTHTVAFLCDGLEQNKPLIDYINKTHNWNLCIHGWNHHNYCKMNKSQIEDELDKCILKVEELFGVVPEKWYLPFNGWVEGKEFDLVPYVAEIAIYHGVDVDIDCYHISDAVAEMELGRKITTDTVWFNNWDIEDLKLLPQLLFLTSQKPCKG
jgi:peptidoglycan/xylan/chitin deacetylase (PgdA/CDA1 family)